MPVVEHPERVAVALPLSAKIAVGVAGLALVGILVVLIAVLASLEGTRSEIRTTRMGVNEAEQRFQRITAQLEPLLAAVEPLADGTSQRDLARTGRSLTRAADKVPGLADDARRGLDAAVFIASTLRSADIEGALGAVRSATEAIVRDVLPAASVLLDDLDLSEARSSLLAELDTRGALSVKTCDTRLRDLPPSASGQLGCLLRTVPNMRLLLRTQRSILRSSDLTQKRIATMLAESLAIQRGIREHVRSLDQKTGGTSPAAR
jgi:hypothetical protein